MSLKNINPNLKKKLGAAFKSLRLEADLSVQKTAGMLGVSPYTIYAWERGANQCPLAAIQKLMVIIAADLANKVARINDLMDRGFTIKWISAASKNAVLKRKH